MAAQLAELNTQRLTILRRREVERRTGLSRTSLYERIAAGTFPRPVNLGGGQSVGWYEHEVETWISSLPRARAGERAESAK
ncbi:MAG: AlpA family phage regulatory protein [Sulfuricellaceae bacterium]|nr:AlpA family phage regulatory protein [Sulfuricellaceae bacterium]